MTRGVMAEVSYTFSKTMSDAPGFGSSPQNAYNPAAERSLSSYDRPHMLIANYLYELPSFAKHKGYLARAVLDGWQWTGIVQFQSGTPFTVALGSATPGLASRPNLQSGAQQKLVKKVTEWFDPNVYSVPAPGYFGTLKPYSLDRKSTRLNSSHLGISYAVFCLKKKTKINHSALLTLYVFIVLSFVNLLIIE